ncbi:MAG TPA: hypothetical protein VE422_16070 [Terriglobia bacterium]|nr:hypothetical protein [Terriglobia bacterium]
MKQKQFVFAGATIAAFVAILLAGRLLSSPLVEEDDNDNGQSKVQKGFAIAPVKLNLAGKNRELVGLGSYLVNTVGDCNGCHSAGPVTQYSSNPYFRSPFFTPPKKVNPATYLGGGFDFGPLGPTSPNIVSRNLTPDKTGRPEGGAPFGEFLQIMRNGTDFDHLHPNCSATITTNCLQPPFNGNLLQVMPWPAFQDMTDHDLRAIYEYLSAIPCIEGPPAPSELHHDCR